MGSEPWRRCPQRSCSQRYPETKKAALPIHVSTDQGGQHRAEATESPRPVNPALDDWSAGDEAIDDDDHRDHEQDVDQTAADVHDEESKNPQNEQDYRDGPKHYGILARSELHPARKIPAVGAARVRPGVMLRHTMQDGNQYAASSTTA